MILRGISEGSGNPTNISTAWSKSRVTTHYQQPTTIPLSDYLEVDATFNPVSPRRCRLVQSHQPLFFSFSLHEVMTPRLMSTYLIKSSAESLLFGSFSCLSFRCKTFFQKPLCRRSCGGVSGRPGTRFIFSFVLCSLQVEVCEVAYFKGEMNFRPFFWQAERGYLRRARR